MAACYTFVTVLHAVFTSASPPVGRVEDNCVVDSGAGGAMEAPFIGMGCMRFNGLWK